MGDVTVDLPKPVRREYRPKKRSRLHDIVVCRSRVTLRAFERLISSSGSYLLDGTRSAYSRHEVTSMNRTSRLCAAALLAAGQAVGQAAGSDQPKESESKRILGIIPNSRTSPTLDNFEPLTAGQKFKLASDDAVDRGTVALAEFFAGVSQWSNSNRSFGQGAAGYGRYFGAAYGDLFIGDYMSEAVFPTLLHQDPRYFRRGSGTGWSRLGYAVKQIFLTHNDSGKVQFNYSEIVGNSTAVAISNAYYADNRTASNGATNLGIQLGFDTMSNILTEFWPDLQRKFRRKPRQ